MRVTTQGEYGLRCMIQIAKNTGGSPVSIQTISVEEKLPRTYVEQLLLKLRRCNLITSIRGAHGGYLLAKPMKLISIREVIQALEGNVFEIVCERKEKKHTDCKNRDKCGLSSLWKKLQTEIEQILEQTSLEDIVNEEQKLSA